MDNEPTLRFRWNDHVPHLSKVFSEQRIDEQYCNTSLVTDDGYIIKVHGIILTMTSGYFERILRNVSQDQHPIIVLNGVNYSELICVIDYIYQGLTRVDERLMASVLDLADILEIKGLSKMKNNMSVKKLIAPSNPLSILPHLHCNPKIIASISSLSQNSDNHTLKSDSEDTSSLEKERRDYEVALDRNIVCMKDLKERYHQISENLEDHSQISENVNLSEQAEESMDQTLGIDLSLSKSGSSVVINKDNGKSFNFYEDGSLRKRKCNLENSDNFRNISNDVDFGKIGDKVEIDVLYKQKKLFGKSPVTTVMDISIPDQEEKKTKSNEFTLERLATLLSKEKNDNINSSDKSLQNILTLNNKEFTSMSIINDKNSTDSEVEVSCSDGGLTISVTTGAEQQNLTDNFKLNGSRSNAHVSLSLRKSKRKLKTKKDFDDSKKKWLAKERRNLFQSCITERPNTRSLMKQKVVAEDDSSEAVSINCDPPFPTDDANHQKQAHNIVDFSEKELAVVSKEKSEINVNLSQTEIKKRVEDSCKVINSETIEGTKRKTSISPLTLFTLPPIRDKEKQRRISLTLERKIKVIEAFLDGKSQRQIAKIYGIGKTQVNGIVKKREEIFSLYRENLATGEKLTMKRQRKSEYAILNEHLIKWYRHMTIVAGIKITTGMLRAKALQIAPDLGCHDFKGSNGWLATFKSNNNLKFSKSKAKTKVENDPNQNYEEESANNEDDETEFFEDEDDDGHVNNLSGSSHGNTDNSVEGGESSTIPSGSSRSELHLLGGSASINQPSVPGIGGIGNISIGNSLLSSNSLKPSQMSNVPLSSNLAYNLTRDHTRSEMTRSELSHISDLHSSNVNPTSSLPHPSISKPDSALSYKSEDSLSYGYDPQTRMNESSTRGTTEYNYTHYGFPSTYYGYHFLGQY